MKDFNWWDKRVFQTGNYNCGTGWRRAMEENRNLKMKAEALARGWRRTLDGLSIWSDLVPSVGMAPPEEALPVVFLEGVCEFRECGEEYI